MLTIEAAGQRIAADLDDVENATNEAMRKLARLQVSMMNARLDSDLRPYDGQLAVMRVAEAQQQLVAVMSNLAKAHKSMRDDFTKIKMPTDDNDRCPVRQAPQGAQGIKAA